MKIQKDCYAIVNPRGQVYAWCFNWRQACEFKAQAREETGVEHEIEDYSYEVAA